MLRPLKIAFKGIFAKFTLMFILVGLIPTMGMSYLIFEKLPDEIESYMVASYEEALLYSSKNISLKLQEFDLLTQNIYQYGQTESTTFGNMLRGHNYNDLTPNVENFIEDYLRVLLYSESHIESVFLLGPDRKAFDYYSKSSNYYYENLQVDQSPNFNSIYDDKKALSILPTHSETYFSTTDKKVLTFARNYLDLNALPVSETVITTLLMDVNISFVDEIVRRMSLTDKGEVSIIDASNYPIYPSYDQHTYKFPTSITQPLIDGDLTSGHQIIEGRYLFYQKIEDSNWLMLYSVDQSSVLKMIDDFKAITIVILGGIIIALIMVAISFSSNLSKPITSIIAQMQKISAGNLDTRIHVKGSYEVTQLADAFNEVTEQLGSHINKAYGAQIKQREAELGALKSQIRPHYLYNTLEIIRMSSLEEGAPNTKEMIESLSEQLKYVIGQYGDTVSLGTELGIIENYFKIIERQYEGRISLAIDIPKDYYDYPMLKLLIQPLIENAVIHGLKPKKGKGKVHVSGKVLDGVLHLQVMDDGVGMSETKLNDIRLLLASSKMGHAHNGNWENIGLKNVNERIQLYYGKAYGLSISSKQQIGTKMSISFPIERGMTSL